MNAFELMMKTMVVTSVENLNKCLEWRELEAWREVPTKIPVPKRFYGGCFIIFYRLGYFSSFL